MKIIPNVYYHKDIINLVDGYLEEGYSDYDALDDGHKESLSTLCIKVLGNDAYEAIIDEKYLHLTLHHLTKYMLLGSREYAYDLAETMRKNAINYFSDVLNDLFNERSEQKEIECKIDAGLRPNVDRVNGEIRWY
jgi:hypothetical protein